MHVVNVLFVLSKTGVEIECGGIRHIATGVVGNDGNVISYLVLLRPAFLRIK